MKKLLLLIISCVLMFIPNVYANDDARDNKTIDKSLVVYFSCTGNTKKLALSIADIIGAKVYEIVPLEPYSDADRDYHNDKSRTAIENRDVNCRPKIKDNDANISAYDTIVLAYPIWWGSAPRIIQTFLTSYDFSNKNIIPICTSGGSGIGESVELLKKTVKGKNVTFNSGKRFKADVPQEEIEAFIDTL